MTVNPSSRSSGIKLVVVVSDLHCGSTVGLMTPTFKRNTGHTIGQNLFQQWLWACWEYLTGEWLASVVGSDPFDLVVNGDAIDGNHHRTKEIISPDEADHVKAAEEVLKPIVGRARQTFFTVGTECHVGEREHSLAKSMGAVLPNSGDEAGAWQHLPLRVHGTLCSFRHHTPAASRVYLEASQLSIQLGNEQLECVRAGWPLPRVLCRAHRHRGGLFSDGNAAMLITGGFQGATRHVHKVVPGAVCKPTIGVLDWRHRPMDSVPVIHQEVCTPPSPAEVVL